ncbi:MAG: DNA translocase FtsK [Turicibacter sp.]|nr:DNA translocase FtsK [Turicibacter sp.]
MAKKKKMKDKAPMAGFLYELVGIFLFVMMLLMIGNLGLIGIFLRRIAVVTFGEFFWLFGLILMSFSFQMVVARKKPSLFSIKYFGTYLIFTSITIFTHTPVWRAFVENGLNFTAGIGQFYLQVDVLADYTLVGGGVFGAFIWLVFAELVTWMGMWLIAFIMAVYGLLLVCGLSVKELYDKRKEGAIVEAFNKAYRYVKERLPKLSAPAAEVTEPVTEKKAKVVRVAPKKVFDVETAEIEEVPSFKITDFAENLTQQMEQKEPVRSADENYVLPPMSLLIDHTSKADNSQLTEAAKEEALKLEETFANFDVRARVSEVHIGPTVTRYEVTPASGVKVNKITGLIDDIALALAVKGVRMEAPIPGKSAVGIEVPNKEAQMVSFKEMMDEMPADETKDKLLIALGRDISGTGKYAALNKMPHLLVAGATGSGKSVCINTMICSLLMRFSATEVRLLLVDPKKVELARYNGLPHLLAPVVTDPQLASAALKKVVEEMERRYDLFAEAVVRDIETYNEWVVREKAKRADDGIVSTLKKLPFIVVILDELADLMMVASREVEDSIMRLTQMARAAGIHLVVATQRPSVDVITGVIKSNIPSRIAFGVSSGTDSRTILDAVGAEKLLGRGDMLFLPMGDSTASRVQGAFITDDEVARIVEFIKGQELGSEIASDFLESVEVPGSNSDLPSDDALIRDVLAFAFETQKLSASMLQRRFKIGYNRAARLVDDLEAAGLVGASDGSKGRPVLMDEVTYRELIS